ncbi:MAG: hypothetical protein Q4C48_00690 [Lachnospiraceae bacterium]|nr:hypothetical protein [Lachnospiraceae bacterium]
MKNLTFCKDVRVLEKDRDRKKKLLRDLRSRKPRLLTSYCITDDDAETLEVVPAWTLLQPDYPAVRVVGIAGGRGDALELLTELIRELYAETGGMHSRSYLL